MVEAGAANLNAVFQGHFVCATIRLEDLTEPFLQWGRLSITEFLMGDGRGASC